MNTLLAVLAVFTFARAAWMLNPGLMESVSRDGGETWEGGLPFDGRRGVSYPDGCEMVDGSVLVIYDRNRTEDLEILTVRITEADVLAGGEARRQVVTRREQG